MKVAILQPSFIPWRGYFDLMRSVDAFVYLDDVQLTKRDWRNRNYIKGPNGLVQLVIPVKGSRNQLISQAKICSTYGKKYIDKNLKAFISCYQKAEFFSDALEIFESTTRSTTNSLLDLNTQLDSGIAKYLDISTSIFYSSDIVSRQGKTARLVDIINELGGDVYLTGPSAKSYLELHEFDTHNIKVQFKSYDYQPYRQLWGSFEPRVSILDAIANLGTDAKFALESQTGNDKADQIRS